jgi:hypothetical protein
LIDGNTNLKCIIIDPTDDADYTAHSGLVGKKIGHPNLAQRASSPFAATSDSIAQSLLGQNGQDCLIRDECTVQHGNIQASGCSPMKYVGMGKGEMWRLGKIIQHCPYVGGADIQMHPSDTRRNPDLLDIRFAVHRLLLLKTVFGEEARVIAMASVTLVKQNCLGLVGEVGLSFL